MSSQATLFEENLTRYQELVGYAIPAVFSAVAASCETQAEAFLAVAVMVSILARTPEWHFIRNFRQRSRAEKSMNGVEDERSLDHHIGMHPLPSIIVSGWFLLIGFGVIQ